MGQKYTKNLQPPDATFHAQDENEAAHNGLVAKTSATQDGIALLKTIHDICRKKDGGSNAMTILDLVQMDKELFLVHQALTEHL